MSEKVSLSPLPPSSPRHSVWTFTTYFAEGLPYMAVRFLSSVFFTDIGVREAYLGFLNFLGLFWNVKFLWAPILDLFGTKRNWLLGLQGAITLLLLCVTVAASYAEGGKDGFALEIIAFLFIVLAFLSATNDIAIDAYYLEALPSEKEQSLYSGLRVLAYRLAVVYARSVLVIVAGMWGWVAGFGGAALTMLFLSFFHLLYLRPTRSLLTEKREGFSDHLRLYLDAFKSYLSQEKVVLILLFIVLYKLGDEILFSMNTPFLMRELGMSKEQLGWVAGIVGTSAAIVGSLAGGKWISTRGLKKAAWPITIVMNVTIPLYALLAWFKPDPSTLNGITLIAAINGYEQFAAGLGTAVLIVFLMGKCGVGYSAAHYAIGSAIMSLGGTFMGGFGGVFVEHYGYVALFFFGFAASIPSMVLLFFVPLEPRIPSE